MNSQLTKEIRKFVYDYFIEYKRAPLVEQIQENFQISKKHALNELQILETNHLLVMQPSTERILVAHPFSNIPTAYQIYSSTKKKP